MPKINPEDSISPIVGDDVGLMVRGFSSALEDAQILVQRSSLDLVNATLRTDGAGYQKYADVVLLLLTKYLYNSPTFRDTRREEQLLLMRAMTSVVLRRDLSLSRRLYSWLLGSSDDSDTQIKHLRQNGLSLLHDALTKQINDVDYDEDDLTARQRPYKIIISLLDKWEISYPLTEVMVLDVLRALEKLMRADELHDEV